MTGQRDEWWQARLPAGIWALLIIFTVAAVSTAVGIADLHWPHSRAASPVAAFLAALACSVVWRATFRAGQRRADQR